MEDLIIECSLNEQVTNQRLIIDNENRFPRIGHGRATRHRRSGNGFSWELHHPVDTFDQHIERQALSDKIGHA